jgi:hypothetical protein
VRLDPQREVGQAVKELLRIGRGEVGNGNVPLASLRAPDDPDHPLRGKPITLSGASRSPIPEQAEHL